MLGTVQFAVIFYSPSPPPSNGRLLGAPLMAMATEQMNMLARHLSESGSPSNSTAVGLSANLTMVTIRAAIIELLTESTQLTSDFDESDVDVLWHATESTAHVTVQETAQDDATQLQAVVNNNTFLTGLATELEWPPEAVEFEQSPVVAYVIVRAPKSPPSPPGRPPNLPPLDADAEILGVDGQSDALTRTAEAASALPPWLLGVIGFVLLIAIGIGSASLCLCCKRRRNRDGTLLSSANRKVGLAQASGRFNRASARYSQRNKDGETLTEERMRVRSERLRDLASKDGLSICKCSNGRSSKGRESKPEQAHDSLLGSQQRSHWKTGLLAMRSAKALHHTWSMPAPDPPPKQASRAGSAALDRARANRKQQSDSSLRKQLTRQFTSGKLRTTPTDSSCVHYVHDGPGGAGGRANGSTKVRSPRHEGQMMGGVMLGGEQRTSEQQKSPSTARVTFRAQPSERNSGQSHWSDLYPQVGAQSTQLSPRNCAIEGRASARRFSAAERKTALALGGQNQVRSSKRAGLSTKMPGIDGGGCLCSMKL